MNRASAFLRTCLLFVPLLWANAERAQAQAIEQPRSHPHYGVELEPHLVVQWDHEPGWGGDGIGVGFRGSIPVMQDGPVTSINNSLALGFGLDWAHFGDNCYPGPRGPYYSCAANDFWIPFVVQWNFFFSKLISAFPELGLAIHHTRFDGDLCRNPNGSFYYCTNSGSVTGVDLVLWLGVRFHLSQSFALTLRLGTPSLLLGAAFFL